MDTFSHRAGSYLARFGRKKRELEPVVVGGGLTAMEPRVVANSSGDAAD
jgi:hypothetical protein